MDEIKKKVKDITETKYFTMFPNFKDEKTQKLTSIIFTLIAVVLFGVLAVNPTLSTIVKLRKELDDKKFLENSLQEKIKNLKILQQKYLEIQPDISYVLSAVPSKPNAPTLLAQIQALAIKSNINLTNLQNLTVELFSQKIQEEKKYYSFSFSLNGTGEINNIQTFTTHLTDMQRIINITNFSIDQTSDNINQLRFTMQGNAYYKP